MRNTGHKAKSRVNADANLFLDQPLQMNPSGQHGGKQSEHAVLHFAGGRGQGANDHVQPYLLHDVLEGCRRLASDSAQSLQGRKHRFVTEYLESSNIAGRGGVHL